MIGIYCIRNTINNKRYVGKSKNIEKRFWTHKNLLTKCSSSPEKFKRVVNRHLANAVIKYGIEAFEFEILEVFDICDETILADAEVRWMEYYDSTNRSHGYNLMKDSSQKVIVHEETRKIISEANTGEKNPNFGNFWSEDMKNSMSKIKKKQHEDGLYSHMQTPEWKAKLSAWSSGTWKDSEKKNKMARKVAEAKSNLRFEQFDKFTGELVGEYNSLLEIMDKYPDFHKISIYSACNGWKKTYRGFVWKSYEKCNTIPDLLMEDK